MAKHIELPQDEKTELEQLIKSGEHKARVISRARVLLLLDRSQGEKRTLAQVAKVAMLSAVSVSHIKRRYFDGGLDRALYDNPRPGRPGGGGRTGLVAALRMAVLLERPLLRLHRRRERERASESRARRSGPRRRGADRRGGGRDPGDRRRPPRGGAHRAQRAWMVVAQDALAQLEGLEIQRLGLVVASEAPVQAGQVVHRVEGARVVVAEDAFLGLEGLEV